MTSNHILIGPSKVEAVVFENTLLVHDDFSDLLCCLSNRCKVKQDLLLFQP